MQPTPDNPCLTSTTTKCGVPGHLKNVENKRKGRGGDKGIPKSENKVSDFWSGDQGRSFRLGEIQQKLKWREVGHVMIEKKSIK